MLTPSTYGNMKPSFSDLKNDYFVTTASYQRSYELWKWEIKRRSEPLGIKLYGDDFISEHAAKVAGENRLKELLDALWQEIEG